NAPESCPVGYFCPEGADPVPCPLYTYRNVNGGKTEGKNKEFCFPGTMRLIPGAKSASDCQKCQEGNYCPTNGTSEIIPCKEKQSCPAGTASPLCCSHGNYCGKLSSMGKPCPSGFYCSPCSGIDHTACIYPYVCESGSITPNYCPIGKIATASSNRTSINISCELCGDGSYSNFDRTKCLMCQAGYYCKGGKKHACPRGSYCPKGVISPQKCLIGYYGPRKYAKSNTSCIQCIDNYYSNSGAITCISCGKSAVSKKGSGTCECIGKNRTFRKSDGECVCKGGYIFYDESDKKMENSDSIIDCQRITVETCGTDECRSPNTMKCISTVFQDCSDVCTSTNVTAQFDAIQCRCICSINNIDCNNCTTYNSVVNTFITLNVSETFRAFQPQLNINENESSFVYDKFDIFMSNSDKNVYSQKSSILQFCLLTESKFGCFNINSFNNLTRLLDKNLQIFDNIVYNPIVCLNENEGIVYYLHRNNTANKSDVQFYPMYNQNHLYNTNENFDFYSFIQFSQILTETKSNFNTLVSMFNSTGIHVVQHSSNIYSQIIVDVKTKNSCTLPRVKPLNSQTLSEAKIKLKSIEFAEPDFFLIKGMLIFFGIFILFTIFIVIAINPKSANIYSLRHWLPKFKDLGFPASKLVNTRYDKILNINTCHHVEPNLQLLEKQLWMGVGFNDYIFDDLNIKLFYDKLENQNMLTASQLKNMKDSQLHLLAYISGSNAKMYNLINGLIYSENEKKCAKTDKNDANGDMGQKNLQKCYNLIENVFTSINTNYDINQYSETTFTQQEHELMLELKSLIKSLVSDESSSPSLKMMEKINVDEIIKKYINLLIIDRDTCNNETFAKIEKLVKSVNMEKMDINIFDKTWINEISNYLTNGIHSVQQNMEKSLSNFTTNTISTLLTNLNDNISETEKELVGTTITTILPISSLIYNYYIETFNTNEFINLIKNIEKYFVSDLENIQDQFMQNVKKSVTDKEILAEFKLMENEINNLIKFNKIISHMLQNNLIGQNFQLMNGKMENENENKSNYFEFSQIVTNVNANIMDRNYSLINKNLVDALSIHLPKQFINNEVSRQSLIKVVWLNFILVSHKSIGKFYESKYQNFIQKIASLSSVSQNDAANLSEAYNRLNDNFFTNYNKYYHDALDNIKISREAFIVEIKQKIIKIINPLIHDFLQFYIPLLNSHQQPLNDLFMKPIIVHEYTQLVTTVEEIFSSATRSEVGVGIVFRTDRIAQL
ncbi:hypothetical protein A3Q56_07360, partial [Intoshia linei]